MIRDAIIIWTWRNDLYRWSIDLTWVNVMETLPKSKRSPIVDHTVCTHSRPDLEALAVGLAELDHMVLDSATVTNAHIVVVSQYLVAILGCHATKYKIEIDRSNGCGDSVVLSAGGQPVRAYGSIGGC